MRYLATFSFLLLAGFSFQLDAQNREKIAGVWKMDPARSESAHQDVPLKSITLTFRITDTDMTVERTWSESDKAGLSHESLSFKLDGSDTTTYKEDGTSVTGKAHWENGQLTIETARKIQEAEVTTKQIYTLNESGREMTVDMTLTVQHGYQGTTGGENTGHGKDVFVRTST